MHELRTGSLHSKTTEHMDAGSHMCLIYSSEEERRKVMAEFLGAGLAAGDYVRYLSDADVRQTIEWLRAEGVSAAGVVTEGCVHVTSAETAYYPNGLFVVDDMLKRVEAISREADSCGHPTRRGAAETDWATRGIPGSDGFVDYEIRVTGVLSKHRLSAICQFDSRQWDGETLFRILQVHPKLFVRGQVLENPYYTAPEQP